MEEPDEPSYQQAMQRKRAGLRQTGRKTTNLMFVASLLMIAAFILYFIPASGIAFLLTSAGAFACILVAIILGLRAHRLDAHAQKQVEEYQTALGLPGSGEAERRFDAWTDSILRWCFRLLAVGTFLISFGEIALLWQQQPSIHQQLIILGATIFTAAACVVGMWITSQSQEPKSAKKS